MCFYHNQSSAGAHLDSMLSQLSDENLLISTKTMYHEPFQHRVRKIATRYDYNEISLYVVQPRSRQASHTQHKPTYIYSHAFTCVGTRVGFGQRLIPHVHTSGLTALPCKTAGWLLRLSPQVAA